MFPTYSKCQYCCFDQLCGTKAAEIMKGEETHKQKQDTSNCKQALLMLLFSQDDI